MTLLLVYTLPGVALGIACRRLLDSFPGLAAAGQGAVAIAALAAIVLVPLIFWFSTARGARAVPLLFALTLGGLLALGIGMTVQRYGVGAPRDGVSLLALSFALPVAFVLTPFHDALRARSEESLYAGLFRRAWAQAVIGAIALSFAGAVLLLNVLLVELLDLLSIEFGQALYHPDWLMAIAGGAFAAAIGMAREQEGIVHALRGLVLTLARTLMPVHLAIVTVFLIAAVIQGPSSLQTGVSVTALLLGVAALAATFVASALEDGSQPIEPGWRRQLTRLLAALLLPLSLLAAWSLWLRIDDYGLTPARVVAAVCTLLAISYGVGYVLAALRPGFERMVAGTNIVLALLGSSFGAAMLTPWGDPVVVSVRDQLARTEAGVSDPLTLDLAWFAFQTGDIGRAALDRIRALPMADEPPLADRLAALDSSENEYAFRNKRPELTELDVIDRSLDSGDVHVTIREQGSTRKLLKAQTPGSDYAPLTDAGLTALLLLAEEHGGLSRSCSNWLTDCTVLASDAPGLLEDAVTALVIARRLNAQGGPDLSFMHWYSARPGREWILLDDGALSRVRGDPVFYSDEERDAWFEAVRDGQLPLIDVQVKAVQIGDRLIVPDGQSSEN